MSFCVHPDDDSVDWDTLHPWDTFIKMMEGFSTGDTGSLSHITQILVQIENSYDCVLEFEMCKNVEDLQYNGTGNDNLDGTDGVAIHICFTLAFPRVQRTGAQGHRGT